MSKTGNTLIGLAAGTALGALAGLLLAPDNGRNTRNKIRRKAVDTKDDLVDKANSLSHEITSRFNTRKREFENELDGLVADMHVKADDVITTLERKLETMKKRNEKINAN